MFQHVFTITIIKAEAVQIKTISVHCNIQAGPEPPPTKDQHRETDLQRKTSGCIQALEPPPSLPIKLQQVRVVLPVGDGMGQEERGSGSGCGSRNQPRGLLPSAGRTQNCNRLNQNFSNKQALEIRVQQKLLHGTALVFVLMDHVPNMDPASESWVSCDVTAGVTTSL